MVREKIKSGGANEGGKDGVTGQTHLGAFVQVRFFHAQQGSWERLFDVKGYDTQVFQRRRGPFDLWLCWSVVLVRGLVSYSACFVDVHEKYVLWV